MNRLADNALFEAFLCGRRVVSRADVERAHRDLGFSVASEPPRRAAEAGDPGESVRVAPARVAAWPGGSDAPSEPTAIVATPVPLDPFAGDGDALGDLDSELEAIFEGADDAPPRRLRSEPEKPLLAQLLED
jgi:hypothetical protein